MLRRDFLTRMASTSSWAWIAPLLSNGCLLPAFATARETSLAESTEAKLAKFAVAIRYDGLPPDVVASAKRVLLDTLGCAFGAVGSDAADIAEKTVRRTFGQGNNTTVIGYPPLCQTSCRMNLRADTPHRNDK